MQVQSETNANYMRVIGPTILVVIALQFYKK